MDLKIEVRNLFALHEATIRLEHGVREAEQPQQWRPFSPSRFIYAFFTFNSIYSFDWERSLSVRNAIRWIDGEEVHGPREEEQIKAYLRVMSERLHSTAPELFALAFQKSIPSLVQDPGAELRHVTLTNASKSLIKLADQLPQHVNRLLQGKVKSDDFYATAMRGDPIRIWSALQSIPWAEDASPDAGCRATAPISDLRGSTYRRK